MTFNQLKNSVEVLLKSRREISLPDAEILKTLAYKHMMLIANRYIVRKLISNSQKDRVLRTIGKGYFLRFPKEISSEGASIDLDEELHIAIAHFIASDIASDHKNQVDFKKDAQKIVKDYSFKIKNTQEVVYGS